MYISIDFGFSIDFVDLELKIRLLLYYYNYVYNDDGLKVVKFKKIN
jgi:hypothetical protein